MYIANKKGKCKIRKHIYTSMTHFKVKKDMYAKDMNIMKFQ